MDGVDPTDETIKKNVVNHLYWDSRIDASNVSVEVDDGEVSLKGTVPSNRTKEAAADAATDIDGAAVVWNNLDVELPSDEESLTDERIRSRVTDTLAWDTDIDSTRIDIDVQDGFVTLRGSVQAGWKKYRAEDKVVDLDGVVDVTNELSVVPTENILDETIAEDLVQSLERNLHTNADDIGVTVEDGDVTLSGIVSTLRAREEAFEAALRTAGVSHVDNNIVVESTTPSTI